MKTILYLGLLVVTCSARQAQSQIIYSVDSRESTMRWTGYYLFSFGEHTGTIQISKGQLTTSNGSINGGSFEIDMTTLNDTDMKPDDGGNDLTNHLKSDDFFAVDKFPTSEFVITKAERIKDARPNEPNYDISGILTLKGVKNTLTFPAMISMENNVITAIAKFKFDRTKWNVKYNSGKFFNEIGDGAISDAIGIELKLKASQL